MMIAKFSPFSQPLWLFLKLKYYETSLPQATKERKTTRKKTKTPTKRKKKKNNNGENSLLTSIGVRGYNRGTVQVIVHYLNKRGKKKNGQKKKK